MTQEKNGLSYKEVIMQRHADYYFTELMTQADRNRLEQDFLQIGLAIKRLSDEDVGSLVYVPSLLKLKFLELAGDYTTQLINKLLDGSADGEDKRALSEFIEEVKKGNAQLPENMNIPYLEQLLESASPRS